MATTRRLRTTIHIFLLLSLVALCWSAAAHAQPVSATTTAPVAGVPAPMAAPVPMKPAMSAVTPAPVVATPVVQQAKDTPVWKSPGFWIGVIGGPAVGVILSLLLAFGVIQKKHIRFLRRHKVVEIADKVVNQFEAVAASTPVLWDDVVAQALKAVVQRVGDLTEKEKVLVQGVVEERQEQAEKALSAPEDSEEEE